MAEPARPTPWGALKPIPLREFFKTAKHIGVENGGDHLHAVQIEHQRVSNLAVYRMVHEQPLSVKQLNLLKKLAFEAGMSGWFNQVAPSEGRTGSVEFRFSADDEKLIEQAFRSAHGRNVKPSENRFDAKYKFL
ncbi:hypothetical protein HYV43_07155 [Candidatus Micrarchaeota archaeon]|nr:hypothetical protein [Candidatus Micrarchaeota archaeon]